MSRIDPALMRIALEASPVLPAAMIADTSSSVHANLNGSFHRQAYSAHPVPAEYHAAMVVAHEQRHYLDYHLTNYGSWLSRFWGQMKQTVPALLYSNQPLTVPVVYMEDGLISRALGLTVPVEGTLEWVAVRLAANHMQRVTRDRVRSSRMHNGLAGSAQLEALATAFEVGPVESILHPREAWPIMAAIPRHVDRWERDYVWLGNLLAGLDIGPPPIPVGDDGQAAHTRVWPPLLVAALMGRFEHLTAERLDDDPHLWGRIMPSARLADLLAWLHNRYAGKLTSALDVWEAVNEACSALYGASVVDSLASDVAFLRAKFDGFVQSSGSWTWHHADIGAHIALREWVADAFAAAPEYFLDPIAYWAEGGTRPEYLPEYYLASKHGFSHVPVGFVPFDSQFYRPAGASTVHFLKVATPSEQHAAFQRVDEVYTVMTRYLVRGARSPSWIGPELDEVEDWLTTNFTIHLVPPFGQRRSEGLNTP